MFLGTVIANIIPKDPSGVRHCMFIKTTLLIPSIPATTTNFLVHFSSALEPGGRGLWETPTKATGKTPFGHPVHQSPVRRGVVDAGAVDVLQSSRFSGLQWDVPYKILWKAIPGHDTDKQAGATEDIAARTGTREYSCP